MENIPAPDSPQKVLQDIFGYSDFRTGQEDVITQIVGGRHVLAIMSTGAGKSLCYQIPALMMSGRSVVISPLIALMNDQVTALRENGVSTALIHSGQDRDDNVANWRAFQSGDAKMLYLSPERLMTPRMLSALGKLDIDQFVIDEAHCISKWGPAFRPEYEALMQLHTAFPKAVISAFTATADARTRRDIAQKLFGGKGDIIQQSFDRPNLELAVKPRQNRKTQLLALLDDVPNQSGIVYCLSRKSTEETAAFLRSKGYNALAYHAGLPQEVRFENQERFMAEDSVIMVATVAFGMGIDKPDIRFVFHMNLPGSLEAYFQEIGRAGRDGKPALTAMLFGMDDVAQRRRFITQENPSEAQQRDDMQRLDRLVDYCEASTCRRQVLLAYFGETSNPCGNCDNCIEPPEMVDVTAPAQLVAQAMIDTGQRFASTHIIDVLRGKTTDRTEKYNHDRVPSFGAGQGHNDNYIRALIRRMITGGYIAEEPTQWRTLSLTEDGEALLRGEAEMRCRKIETKPARIARRTRNSAALSQLSARDAELFAALKAKRFNIARQIGKPAYVVFTDATLMDMATRRPGTLEDMLEVSGMGQTKLSKYGQIFLEVIAQI